MTTLSARLRILGVLLAPAIAATMTIPSAAQAQGAAATQSSNPAVRVVSFNAMMLNTPNYNNARRAPIIANAGWLANNDIVAFQELFDNGASDALMAGVASKYPYRTPIVGRTKAGWDATQGAWNDLTPEDGGTAIVSKWPITTKIQVIYQEACGADWFALKGFAYARIMVNGTPVHVVATHGQSQDSACASGAAESARAAQWKQITDFLNARSIPSTEQVIITGDMNVIRGTAEYTQMVQSLNVKAPTAYLGHPYSFDPNTNALTGHRYPGTAPEQLDYVLYRNGHPGSSPVNTLKVTGPAWTSGNTYNDYSDHYPVANY